MQAFLFFVQGVLAKWWIMVSGVGQKWAPKRYEYGKLREILHLIWLHPQFSSLHQLDIALLRIQKLKHVFLQQAAFQWQEHPLVHWRHLVWEQAFDISFLHNNVYMFLWPIHLPASHNHPCGTTSHVTLKINFDGHGQLWPLFHTSQIFSCI